MHFKKIALLFWLALGLGTALSAEANPFHAGHGGWHGPHHGGPGWGYRPGFGPGYRPWGPGFVPGYGPGFAPGYVVTCFAGDNFGRQFYAYSVDAYQAQAAAMQTCAFSGGYCQPLGCR